MLMGEPRAASAAVQMSAPAAPIYASHAQRPAGGVGASSLSKAAAVPVSTLTAAPVKEASGTVSDLAATTAPLERVLQTGQPTFSTQLDFIKVNRAVASLERAVERLELLSLLDATGPGSSTADTLHKGTAAAAATSFQLHSPSRGPAVLAGVDHEANAATTQRIADVLAVSQQQRDRGRASVLELLAEQQALERRYGELLTQAQPTVSLHPGEPQLPTQCFANVRDPAQAALQRELASVSGRLRDTNRLLCTQLQDNPQDMDNWAKVCNERRELTALLKEVIEELTVGYKEVFQQQQQQRQQQQANAALDGGLRRSIAPSTFNDEPRLSQASNGEFPGAEGNGGSVSGLTHHGSRQSSVLGGGVAASSESGSQASPLLKQFGSTTQRRRASRSVQQGPRIPLSSSYQQFAVKILQEEASQRWADEVLAKERALNQNVKQLQADLVRERELKDKEVAERLTRVSALQLELRKLKAALQQRTEAAKARGEAATENLQREGAAEVRDVRQAIHHDEELLAVGAATHEAFSNYLRERTTAMDKLAGEWESKTLRELKRKEAAKIDAEGSRQACAQRLTDLEQEQESQLELKERRDTAQRVEDDARRCAEDQRSTEYAAASVLEAALKAMMTRQTLSKLQKGSKKKKKKGGG
ncbi:hypothetical protein NESM_000105200 [Novymonas esmeraldas]|uniref:Dynein regulatory complex protein 9 n=1 Tax=Novymonas esmeraldas TaxID=1808958 RepID=A0AAW0F4X9_9TRYP